RRPAPGRAGAGRRAAPRVHAADRHVPAGGPRGGAGDVAGAAGIVGGHAEAAAHGRVDVPVHAGVTRMSRTRIVRAAVSAVVIGVVVWILTDPADEGAPGEAARPSAAEAETAVATPPPGDALEARVPSAGRREAAPSEATRSVVDAPTAS